MPDTCPFWWTNILYTMHAKLFLAKKLVNLMSFLDTWQAYIYHQPFNDVKQLYGTCVS